MSAIRLSANIYDTASQTFRLGQLTMENGKITAVSFTGEADPAQDYIIPGLVDVHTHGRNAHDFVGSTVEEMKFMKKEYAKVGSTTVMASLATASFETYCKTIDDIKEAGFDGIHLEGRYLNPVRKGAHDAELLTSLKADEIAALVERVQPLPVHVTAALEMGGGEEFVNAIISRGGTVGIGHSDATYEQAMEAVAWGATSFTHTFNAMSPIHHRKPGCITASLISDAYSEFICDGNHIAPAAVKLAWMAKRHDRFVLVTDSMMATGCEGGDFSIGSLSGVTIKNGVALLPDGTIAGSILNLYDAVCNLQTFTGCTLEEAIPCATINPAKMVGFDHMVGSIEVGKRADLCILAPDRKTMKTVYAAGEQL